MKRYAFLFLWFCCLASYAAEVIPPAPTEYFNDYAHVVDAATASQLNAKLQDFERTTGNQILVAVYPKMQSDSSIADYTVRVARAWQVGQKVKNNGAVLFVFIQEHQMFLEVGYGLEGVLPDALAKQITEYEIKPRFKVGDYSGGLTAGVNAILAATRNEYKGTGTTVYEQRHRGNRPHVPILFIVVVMIFLFTFRLLMRGGGRHGWLYSGGGWGGYYGGGGFGGGGGGGFSGGGGGFSGGGGSFGGGGAGSSW